jgi:hypothetical protein
MPFVKARTKNLFFLAFLSLVMFVVFMISSAVKPCGFFIGEVYFIACSKRMAQIQDL